MVKREIMVCECGCERCSHGWIARSKETPTVCPHCKSPYWNKPKTRHSDAELKKVKRKKK